MRILILAVTSAALQLSAHDLFLMPESFKVEPGKTIHIAVQNGDGFPTGDGAPSPTRLRQAKLIGKSASSNIENLLEAGVATEGDVDVPGNGTLLMTIHTIPNRIVLEPAKFTSYLEGEGLNSVIAERAKLGESDKPGRERYSKYAKALLLSGTPDGNFQRLAGFPIEIVPLADPYKLKAGASLPVKVLLRGQPIAGLQVQSSWFDGGPAKIEAVGRTDAKGEINVPIAQKGKWRLHALAMERRAEGDIDWESYWASLTFEVF